MQGQKKICYTELYGFGANPEHQERLFADRRIEGYARALTGSFVSYVRLFCPRREFTYMRDRMVNEYGAKTDHILHEETLYTTYHNGIVMRRVFDQHGLRTDAVCISSSLYHARAPFCAYRHGLTNPYVPAEAFIFAAAEKHERPRIAEQLKREFGTSAITDVHIDDIKGFGEMLAGEYALPSQLEA